MPARRFDVFMSYNSEDFEEVQQLARVLEDSAKLRVWLDRWQLIPGQPWQRELERGLSASKTCAVVVGSSGRGPWQAQEVDAALRAQVSDPDVRVIPVLLPGAPADAPDLPLFLQGHMWVRFQGIDDADATWLVECGIRGVPPGRGRTVDASPAKATVLASGGEVDVGEAGPVTPTETPAHAFISYRHQEPDRELAQVFADALKRAGHGVFIDTGIRWGANWAKQIGKALAKTDCLLLLLSPEAAASEMVIEEVKVARKLGKKEGGPVILPLRLRYPFSEPLPYLLSAQLREVQQECWNGPEDTSRLIELLLGILGQRAGWASTGEEAGDAVAIPYGRPAPFTDPRLLRLPGGAIDTQARYYVLREADESVVNAVRRQRALVTVLGPRQSGKTSLILRAQGAVEEAEGSLQPVFIDFQAMPGRTFDSLDAIWREIADRLASALQLDELEWREGRTYDGELTRLLDRSVFGDSDRRLLLCLDEVDRVFRYDVRTDFFTSVRSFYNRAAHDRTWKRVSWLLGTSTEPSFFIEDLTQSPFNVGLRVELEPFYEAEITEFARRFSPVGAAADPALIRDYVGGHPYLVHLVLYHLATEGTPAADLFDAGVAAKTVFREHLQRFLFQFQREEPLAKAMKLVVAGKGCADARLANRLRSAGLVKRDDTGRVVPMCRLYADFFGKEL